MTRVQIIDGNFTITDPDWPVYRIRNIITSDNFTGAGPLAGSTTDTHAGGAPMEWSGNPTGYERGPEGLLVGAGDPVMVRLPQLPADIQISFTMSALAALPTSDLVVSARSSTSTTNRVAIHIQRSRIHITERIGGSYRLRETGVFTVTSDDLITIGLAGDTCTVHANGHLVVTSTVETLGDGHVGFSRSVEVSKDVARIRDLVVSQDA